MTIFSAPDTDGIWREKVVPAPVPPPPLGNWRTDTTLASAGQTAFPLSNVPADPANLILWVNGVRYTQGPDYTTAFAVVMWSGAAFTMSAGDEVQAYYEI